MKKERTEIKVNRPGLFILIKDTTQKAFENVQRANPNVRCNEDLIKSFDEGKIFNFYEGFSHRGVHLIPPPNSNDEDGYIIDDPTTKYYQELQKNFTEMMFNPAKPVPTKNKRGVIFYFEKLISIINSENVQGLKSELEGFYKAMMWDQVYETISAITKTVRDNLHTLTPHNVQSKFEEIKKAHLLHLEKKIENMKCQHLFKTIKQEVDKSLKMLLEHYKNEFDLVEKAYAYERERTKKIDTIMKTITTDKIEVNEQVEHGNKFYQYSCCGNRDRNSAGCCKSQKVKEGNAFVNFLVSVVSSGLLSNVSPDKVTEESSHPGKYLECCGACGVWDVEMFKNCRPEYKTKTESFEVPDSIESVYTMDLFNENSFRAKATEIMNKLIQDCEKNLKDNYNS
jgi:hypothetical protein